jgi:hypothetical protein
MRKKTASPGCWPAEMKELIKRTIHKRKQLIAAGYEQFPEEEIKAFIAKYTQRQFICSHACK